ncbi:hypothetical protein FGO68_gene15004 [Halteria grandinella]|uniref:Ankyrin repeat domain-containing protein n=1 Tax=Halteria grandinella TaxID=5974 RepID=A0A8J8P417_HALGN|nr:hypothetical protein FGO68_gene15004 [Halteria grandinella]
MASIMSTWNGLSWERSNLNLTWDWSLWAQMVLVSCVFLVIKEVLERRGAICSEWKFLIVLLVLCFASKLSLLIQSSCYGLCKFGQNQSLINQRLQLNMGNQQQALDKKRKKKSDIGTEALASVSSQQSPSFKPRESPQDSDADLSPSMRVGDKSPPAAFTLQTKPTMGGGSPGSSLKFSEDYVQNLLQCMKDHRMIDFKKIDQFLGDPELNVCIPDKFTKQTPAHFCVKNGHADTLRKILLRSNEAGSKVDDLGNTLTHALMINTISRFNELKQLIFVLKECKAFDPLKRNEEGLKPIDVLRMRKAEKNPYETNLADVGRLEGVMAKEEIGQINSGFR